MKKIIELEQEKKKIQDSLEIKSSQLERIRLENDENKRQIKTPEKKTDKIA